MAKLWSKKVMIVAAALSFLILPLNGCVYLVVGGIGAVGGYVVSPDTVEGTIIDCSYGQVWKESEHVLSNMGILEQRNETAGILQARLQGIRVRVTVFRSGTDSVKLTVKARRSFFPKIKTAQEVYVKIVSVLDAETLEE